MTLTLDAAIDGFLGSITHKCVASTINHYRKRLNSFRTKFLGVDVTTLTADQIKAHIHDVSHWPDGRSKAPDTIRTTVVSWMQLHRWMKKNKHIKKRITKKIEKPGGRKREILPTQDDTRAVIANSQPDFVRIFRALRLTGARPGELVNAKIADYDRANFEIVLMEHKTARKTGKPRRITIGHPALIELIDECIGDRTEGNIFLRNDGEPWNVPLISFRYRKARRKAGLREGLVPYLARHEHATDLYRRKGDLKAVADALGHTQLTTTMRYARPSPERMKVDQAGFNEGLI